MESAQLAVVAGASSGIGLESARLFAADGYGLVAVADEAAIHDVARELADGGGQVEPFRVDLRDDGAVPQCLRHCQRRGCPGARGDRFNVGMQADLDIVDVNVRSTVHLAKLVLRDMAKHNDGRELFTSSIVATMRCSYQTMYFASKAFTQSFAEALHDEFRGTGVSVTALMPGPTDTDFFRRAAIKTRRWRGCRSKTTPPNVQRRPRQNRQTGLRRDDARRAESRGVVIDQQGDARGAACSAGFAQGGGQPPDRHAVWRSMTQKGKRYDREASRGRESADSSTGYLG
jgi:short-subunit dehydrogenase